MGVDGEGASEARDEGRDDGELFDLVVSHGEAEAVKDGLTGWDVANTNEIGGGAHGLHMRDEGVVGDLGEDEASRSRIEERFSKVAGLVAQCLSTNVEAVDVDDEAKVVSSLDDWGPFGACGGGVTESQRTSVFSQAHRVDSREVVLLGHGHEGRDSAP